MLITTELIALSNAISKILESLLCDYIESIDDVDLYQFGFSRSLSTGVFLMRSKTLLTFTDKMAVMYSVVLLISTKHLIVLTTGCCSTNCLIAMILMYVTQLPGYWHTGTVTSKCLFVGKTFSRNALVLQMASDRVACGRHFYFGFRAFHRGGWRQTVSNLGQEESFPP